MAVKTGDLKPYKSVILAQATDAEPVVSALLDDAKPLLGLDQEPDRLKKERRARKTTVPRWVLREIVDDATGKVFRRLVEDGSDEVSTGYLHYVERRAPGWYAGTGVEDQLNCLLVVVQRRRHVALYLSDNRRRAAFQRRLGHVEDDGFSRLRAIGRTTLNSAFVRGPARTLWLSGIHAPVAVKADTKTLSGVDLRDALDPLGDQTYHFTAARSSVPDLLMPVGVAPRSSRIWVGLSRDWTDFCSTMSLLLRHLDSDLPPVGRPLPVLAAPVSADDMPALTEAFELHFLPPELLADDPEMLPEDRELMERWAYRSEFEIVGTGVDSFDRRPGPARRQRGRRAAPQARHLGPGEGAYRRARGRQARPGRPAGGDRAEGRLGAAALVQGLVRDRSRPGGRYRVHDPPPRRAVRRLPLGEGQPRPTSFTSTTAATRRCCR